MAIIILLYGEVKSMCWEFVLHIAACCFQHHVLWKW